MNSASDKSLDELLVLARGERQHLGALLDVHRGYLTMLARLRIVGRLQGKMDASDLVQDTFLAAHQHFSSFEGTTEAEFLAWLRRILASRVSAAVRRFVGAKRRAVELEQEMCVEMEQSSRMADKLVASQSSPSERAVQHERALCLADALELLPTHYREVVLLREFQGLSFPEIGQCMNRSAEAVRKLWVRALAELHELLQDKLADRS